MLDFRRIEKTGSVQEKLLAAILDELRGMRQGTISEVEHQPDPPPEPKRGILARLFRRA